MKGKCGLIRLSFRGDDVTVNIDQNPQNQKKAAADQAFVLTTDPDGEDHLGVMLSEKELNQRLE